MRSSQRTLKKLGNELKHIKLNRYNNERYSTVNLYFQDESRFGLFTRQKRVLTARGVKPICLYQHRFDNTYLFGSFSPITGDSFLLELPHCNTDTFQIYLNEFSAQKPDELKIIILDNGAFHKAKRLQIPDNIIFIFLPPYTPELNPAEKIWRYLKDQISLKVYKNLSALQDDLCNLVVHQLTPHRIKSITGNKFYKNSFTVSF
jgi:transposase